MSRNQFWALLRFLTCVGLGSRRIFKIQNDSSSNVSMNYSNGNFCDVLIICENIKCDNRYENHKISSERITKSAIVWLRLNVKQILRCSDAIKWTFWFSLCVNLMEWCDSCGVHILNLINWKKSLVIFHNLTIVLWHLKNRKRASLK